MTDHGKPVRWEKRMFRAMLVLSLIGMIATHAWSKAPLASEEVAAMARRIDRTLCYSPPPAWSVSHRAADLAQEWERPAPRGGRLDLPPPPPPAGHPPRRIEVKRPAIDLLVPVLRVTTADFSGVRIEWEVPKTEAPLGVRTTSARWAHLERRGPGETEFNTLGMDVDPESGSAVDSGVAPRLAYSYRLFLLGDDGTATSNIVVGQMPDDRALRWTGGSGGLYILFVKRWFGATVGWKEEPFNVRIGEPIGREAQERIGGKRLTLDFRTGWVLKGFRAGGSMLPGAPGPRPVDVLEYGEPGGETLVITQEDPVANGR